MSYYQGTLMSLLTTAVLCAAAPANSAQALTPQQLQQAYQNLQNQIDSRVGYSRQLLFHQGGSVSGVVQNPHVASLRVDQIQALNQQIQQLRALQQQVAQLMGQQAVPIPQASNSVCPRCHGKGMLYERRRIYVPAVNFSFSGSSTGRYEDKFGYYPCRQCNGTGRGS